MFEFNLLIDLNAIILIHKHVHIISSGESSSIDWRWLIDRCGGSRHIREKKERKKNNGNYLIKILKWEAKNNIYNKMNSKTKSERANRKKVRLADLACDSNVIVYVPLCESVRVSEWWTWRQKAYSVMAFSLESETENDTSIKVNRTPFTSNWASKVSKATSSTMIHSSSLDLRYTYSVHIWETFARAMCVWLVLLLFSVSHTHSHTECKRFTVRSC